MFTVYVLYSDLHHKIYIGFTSNLEARLASHNAEKGKGYTHRFKPWRVIYTEPFISKAEALKREKQLKSAKGREFVWNLIESSHKQLDSYPPAAGRGLNFHPRYFEVNLSLLNQVHHLLDSSLLAEEVIIPRLSNNQAIALFVYQSIDFKLTYQSNQVTNHLSHAAVIVHGLNRGNVLKNMNGKQDNFRSRKLLPE